MEKGRQIMKKILSLFIALVLIIFVFQINVFASSIPLDSVNVNLSKEKDYSDE